MATKEDLEREYELLLAHFSDLEDKIRRLCDLYEKLLAVTPAAVVGLGKLIDISLEHATEAYAIRKAANIIIRQLNKYPKNPEVLEINKHWEYPKISYPPMVESVGFGRIHKLLFILTVRSPSLVPQYASKFYEACEKAGVDTSKYPLSLPESSIKTETTTSRQRVIEKSCVNCILNGAPYCTDLGFSTYGLHLGDTCPNRRSVRTDVGNFFACAKNMDQFGHGTAYGAIR